MRHRRRSDGGRACAQHGAGTDGGRGRERARQRAAGTYLSPQDRDHLRRYGGNADYGPRYGYGPYYGSAYYYGYGGDYDDYGYDYGPGISIYLGH
jgi:hypothetical protein